MKNSFFVYLLLIISSVLFTAERSDRDKKILEHARARGWQPDAYGKFTDSKPASCEIGRNIPTVVSKKKVLDTMQPWKHKVIPNQIRKCQRYCSDDFVKDADDIVNTFYSHRKRLTSNVVALFAENRMLRAQAVEQQGLRRVANKSFSDTTYDKQDKLPRRFLKTQVGHGYRPEIPLHVDEIPRTLKIWPKDHMKNAQVVCDETCKPRGRCFITETSSFDQGLLPKSNHQSLVRNIRNRPVDCLCKGCVVK